MATSNTRELDFARSMIINHLSTNVNPESLSAILAIQQGDKEELLEHIKALIPIFIEAKNQLEKEMENNESYDKSTNA